MANRPKFLDLSGAKNAHVGNSQRPVSPRFYMDLPSPRAGEVPPALSPLDQFALHSRMLQKRFEEKAKKSGRRVSRLPHDEIASELAKRPDYFRAFSSGSESSLRDVEDEEEDWDNRSSPWVAAHDERPVSHYPRLSNVKEKDNPDMPNRTWFDPERNRSNSSSNNDCGYFGINVPRASSPEPLDSRPNKADPVPAIPSLTSSIDSLQSSQPRTLTNESSYSQRHANGLAPPKSPMHPRSPRSIASIRSVLADDDASESGDLLAPRKSSNSSYMSGPRSPITPDMHPVCRSPSVKSDYSTNSQLPRPSFNFSRPLSSSGNKSYFEPQKSFDERPSFDQASRPPAPICLEREYSAGSLASASSTPMVRADNSTIDDAIFSGDESSTSVNPTADGAPSYVYAKYSLPRGRTVEKNAIGNRDSWSRHQVSYEEPSQPHNVPEPEAALSPTRPDIQRAKTEAIVPDGPGSSVNRSRSAEPPQSLQIRAMHKSVPSSPSVTSSSTDRTIRAGHVRNSPSRDMAGTTPEEHLEKGIECHNSGSLSESTYHLRLAAKAGLPTAMLLYALACRHGWGMRENKAEGVQWLKRALDTSGLDLTKDVDPLTVVMRNSPQMSAAQIAERRTQFALAVYELGISYMNGWGVPKDKALALRCYEISGAWGDCDALAEAGFCYTQGVGCKKDLKKAAGLYRKAAEGGMSMAGNSW